jgi:hypothetical protein
MDFLSFGVRLYVLSRVANGRNIQCEQNFNFVTPDSLYYVLEILY